MRALAHTTKKSPAAMRLAGGAGTSWVGHVFLQYLIDLPQY